MREPANSGEPERGRRGDYRHRTPLLLLLLVPVFSVPFYFIERRSLLPSPMPFIPVTASMVLVPTVLALAFAYKEGGPGAACALLARAFDVNRSRPWFWLLPAVLLLPVALYLAYYVSRMLGNDLDRFTPLWANAGTTLLVFVAVLIPLAMAEELGWMGYAADPLQERWGALGASVIIGLVWAAWHWYPWYKTFGSLEWVLWQTLVDVLLRALTFWMYNNTRRSVFVTAVFHASFNVAYRIYPNEGQTYDPFATVLVLGTVTAIVVMLWGPKDLASYRLPLAARQ